ATAVLVAAFFVAFAVLAADFFASVVERLACVFDLVVPLLLVLSAMKTYPSWSSRMARAGPSLANIRFYEQTFLNIGTALVTRGGGKGRRCAGGGGSPRGVLGVSSRSWLAVTAMRRPGREGVRLSPQVRAGVGLTPRVRARDATPGTVR